MESSDVAPQYERVLQIFFEDGDSEMFEMDIEPVVKEHVEAYWANPSTKDHRITAQALNGDHLQFLCSDVLCFTEVNTTSPEFHALYPKHVRMVELNGQLYYIVEEQHLLARILL